jgi:hypothetical protein
MRVKAMADALALGTRLLREPNIWTGGRSASAPIHVRSGRIQLRPDTLRV